MEKNTFFLRALTSLLFLGLLSPIFAEEKIPLQYGGKYIRFSELTHIFQSLKIRLHNPTLLGKLYSKTTRKSLRFRIDSYFYQHKSLTKKLPEPIRYRKRDIFLPVFLLDTIFLDILDMDVVYEADKESLNIISVSEKEAIHPEKIELKYIILDAGHGGSDPGAIAGDKTYEKDVTLKVVYFLEKLLRKRFPELKVILTRKDDTFIPLKERTHIGNEKLNTSTNSIFVSLHCNAAFNDKANGMEIYYLDQTRRLESYREYSIIQKNLIPPGRKMEIRQIQSGMMSSLIQRRSLRLAETIHYKLRNELHPRIISRGVKRENFHVLRESLMPAVLVEMGFISHPLENKLLFDRKIQMKIAEGIAEGIRLFARSKDVQS
ncbi:MAG: N-acetylmuramoyl-L-alanine amidase [Leptospiraceae bacterium]|nr:N-acetylmuramoyl-L-alanine amidase [Leptospiraceae bacterium]MCP5503116.1 N-acetylmuramoyl-L-alanine amidase [Leptospiraceae bacterium]